MTSILNINNRKLINVEHHNKTNQMKCFLKKIQIIKDIYKHLQKVCYLKPNRTNQNFYSVSFSSFIEGKIVVICLLLVHSHQVSLFTLFYIKLVIFLSALVE